MKSTLGDVADFINGAAFKPEDWGDEGNRIIRIQNLTDKDKPYNHTTRTVSERIHVQPGDLLVSWSATLGVFEWDGPDIAYLNQHIFRVVPDLQKVDKRYLRHALELALLDMRQHLHGATMLHVNRGEFLSTKLYLPPLPEQRRIATILDKADALRTKRREALAQLDRLAQSIFVEMFGDPVTNRYGLPICRFDTVCERIFKGAFDLSASDYLEEGIPFIRISNIQENTIDLAGAAFISEKVHQLYKSSEVIPGDVVFSKVGTIDRIAVVPNSIAKCNISQNNVGAKLNRALVTPEFAITQLTSPIALAKIRSGSKKAVQDKLVLEELRALPFLLPSIDAQNAFVSRLSEVKKVRAKNLQAIEQLENLFQSIQHRAFRGEL